MRLVMITADLPEEGRRVRAVQIVPLGQHDLEAPCQGVAEVAVAHDRVEVAEVFSLSTAVWAIVRTTSSTCSKPSCAIRPPPRLRPLFRASALEAGLEVAQRHPVARLRPAPAASTWLRSPSGSPSELTTSTASRKSSSAV